MTCPLYLFIKNCGALLFRDSYALDYVSLVGGRGGVAFPNACDHFHTAHHFSEHSVTGDTGLLARFGCSVEIQAIEAVQFGVGEVELAAVCPTTVIDSSVCHCQHSRAEVPQIGMEFVVELVAGPACTRSRRVTSEIQAIEAVQFGVGEVELAAVCPTTVIDSSVCHCQHSRAEVPQIGMEFVVELVAGPACTRSRRVTSLGHEAGDDAVESCAIVVAFTREKYEVVDGLRGLVGEQLHLERTAAFHSECRRV